MSDTPRTDAVEKHAYMFKDEWTPVCESKFVRQLELELNAANKRIKWLELAGDTIAAIIGPPGSALWAYEDQVDAAYNYWIKAKDAKC